MSNYMYSSPTIIDPGARYATVNPNVKVQTDAAGVDRQMQANLGTAMQTAQRKATAETLAAQQADAANRRAAASTLAKFDRDIGMNARVASGSPGGTGSWQGGGAPAGQGGGYAAPAGNRRGGGNGGNGTHVGGAGRGEMGAPGSAGGPGGNGAGSGGSRTAPLYGGKLTPDHDWSAFDAHFHPPAPDAQQGPMQTGETLDEAQKANQATPAGVPFRGSTPGEIAEFNRTGAMQGPPFAFEDHSGPAAADMVAANSAPTAPRVESGSGTVMPQDA